MKSSIRGVILGTAGWALLGLVGCENNEANVTGTGVTPPGAAATSEDGLKVKVQPQKAPAGYGPAMGKRAPTPPVAKPSDSGEPKK